MNKLILILTVSIFLFACNTDSKKTSVKNKETEIKVEASAYSINKEDLKFEWTAYKTTKKLAVKGTFDAITIQNDKKNTSIPDLFIDSKFTIDLSSVNSNNEGRDAKLVKFFFGNFSNTKEITGFIKEGKGNNQNGSVSISLKINDLENIVKMDYKIKDDIAIFSGDLDLLDWKVEKSLESLHEACKEKHTGEDGISKTWSEMHIEIAVPLIKH